MNYIFISAFCDATAGLKYDGLCLFTGVLSSDNSIVYFRCKAFLKSDTLAGFTTSVALIWYIECVISSKLNFYSNLFEFGALHFHWMLARWLPTYPRGEGRAALYYGQTSPHLSYCCINMF
jgi:hypothetical protein